MPWCRFVAILISLPVSHLLFTLSPLFYKLFCEFLHFLDRLSGCARLWMRISLIGSVHTGSLSSPLIIFLSLKLGPQAGRAQL